jgi:hypothetical protein
MLTVSRVLPVLVLTTCGPDPSPELPTRGAYDVELVALADDCTPPFEAKPYDSDAYVREDVLYLGLAQPTLKDGLYAIERLSFEPPDYTHEFTELERGQCMTQSRRLTVELVDADSLIVHEEEHWVRADDGCVEVDSTIPHASCDVAREHRFELALACEDPCTIVNLDIPKCTCP